MINFSDRSQVCNLLVGIDEPLRLKYNKNMTALIDLVQKHVDYANEIFTKQVLNEDANSEDQNIYFWLQRIQVMFGSCESLGSIDKNCTEERNLYLNQFNSYDFREVEPPITHNS